MRVFRGFGSLPHFVHPVVTVGSYDGVHRGHRMLLERLVQEARARGGESVVLTFDPHPRIALGRAEGLQLLTTLDQKISLMEELGVDNLLIVPFDRTFSALSGAEFVGKVLVGELGAEALVAGYDHRFGHDRMDCQTLAADHSLRVIEVGECRFEDSHVSSTAIRRLLADGHPEEAERLLGHPLHPLSLVVDPQRTPALANSLVEVWEASVRATHHFLSQQDIQDLIPAVREGLAGIETLVIASGERPCAFMGIEGDKLEMLFVDPRCFKQGAGRKLVRLACERFGVRQLDVNEQNPGAAAFYRSMGFEVVGRSETDAQGRAFPLLNMKLQTQKK